MALEKITYAGHSAVFVEWNGKTIAIDPWLETNPRCPDELKEPQEIDLIVLTHGHSDHAGDAVRLAKHYGCRLAATFELANLLANAGVPQEHLFFMNKGGSVSWESLKITLTHARHSNSFEVDKNNVYAGEACGTVISDEQTAIYHAGDTDLFSDMKLIGEFYKPEIALLPIGDCFTMGPREAARAAQYVGAKKVIPIHYATFDLLTGSAEEFQTACKEAGDPEVIALEPGQSWTA